jgi:ABC-type Zn uptake system ZnuABC Zn-binding protein ZnuA
MYNLRSVCSFGLALAVLGVASPALAKLSIVSTTEDPAALARAIGGERVEVIALAKGFQDPHFLEAKPSYMVRLHQADLVLAVGLDLEAGYLGAILAGAHNDRIAPGQKGFLDLGTVIVPLEVLGEADRSQGDVHPNGNPHYWLDPENGRLMARAIAARLTELDSVGQSVYAANLATFEKALTAKETEWQQRLAVLSGQAIVTFHRSWSYFAKRYNLNVVDFIEPKPGIPPTPAHTLEVIKTIRERGVKIILLETFYDRRVADFIAQKTGARVVAAANSVAGDDKVVTYFDLFDHIVAGLAPATASSPSNGR